MTQLTECTILRLNDSSNKSKTGLRFGVSGDQKTSRDFLEMEVATISDTEIVALRAQPEIKAIAPVMNMRLHQPFMGYADNVSDSKFWGLQAIGATESSYSGKGVTVAVLDTGVDHAHDAFARIKLTQKDFTGDGDGDSHGHGTHCAGTIFGGKVGDTTIGVAPNIDMALVAKVLDDDGSGSTKFIVDGILWALENGANIISMSLGMDFPGYISKLVEKDIPNEAAISEGLEAYRSNLQMFRQVFEFVQQAHENYQTAICICATGNESQRPNFSISSGVPGSASHSLISVAAVERSAGKFKVAKFSNSNPTISAPGVDIISARSGGGLVAMSGTSMATPHATGIAAHWMEKLSGELGHVDPTMLSSKLIGSAATTELTEGFRGVDVGMGLVQAPLPE